jgi:ABC-type branched-subunit amino acid transport system substrate-binding protein
LLGSLLSACTAPPRWRGLVKIGLVAPFHGPDSAEATAAHVAIRQALIDRNGQGGVRGRRLELVSLDDWNDPATGQRRADELRLDPLVLAAVVWRSSAALPALFAAELGAVPIGAGADAPAATARLLEAIEAAAAAGSPTRTAVARRVGGR